MAQTERYGLNRFGGGLGGDLSDEGYKFSNRDRTTIDRVLAALEGHRHSGGPTSDWDAVTPYGTSQRVLPTARNGHVYVALAAGMSGSSEPVWPTGTAATIADGSVTWQEAGNEQTSQLINPIAAPGLSASSSPLGTLPAGTELFYRVGFVDSYGLETASSPEASIATPDPLDTPDVPAGAAAAGGTLEDGNYYYAASFYQSTGNLETEVSDTTFVVCGQGDNTVDLELPPLPAGADGWKIYRLGPSEADLYLLAVQLAGAGTSFLDDGSTAITNPVQLAPLENTTNSQNAVVISCPDLDGGAPPAGVRRWRIYRSETSGDYPDESLVHEVVETTTQGGSILVSSWIDLGDPLDDGIPLEISTAFIPPAGAVTAPHADDVSFDPAGLTYINADNVQDAIEEIDAALAGGAGSGGGGGGGGGGVAASGSTALWLPSDNGLLGWAFDPILPTSFLTENSGELYMVAVKVATDTPTAANQIILIIVGVGTTLTSGQNRVGLYNSAGILLSGSADQTSSWETDVGPVSINLSSPPTVSTGIYHVGVLSVGSSPPLFAVASPNANIGLSTANARVAKSGSGLTALPSTVTMGSRDPTTESVWAAIR